MTQEQKRHIRQLRAAGEGYKRISTLLDIPVGTIKSFCRRDEADDRRRKFCSHACYIHSRFGKQ